jgi:epsilon-lactone hydrolase
MAEEHAMELSEPAEPAGHGGPAVPGMLTVPARAIPVPTSVSPEAQAALSRPVIQADDYPPLDDIAAWRRMITAANEGLLAQLGQFAAASPGAAPTSSEKIVAGGADVFVISPPNADPEDPRILLELHGGGLIVGAGECCRAMAAFTAARLGMRTWAVDYRMPPDHPYPAGLDDCLAAYRALLEVRRPDDIIVSGISAGANLAAALVLRARDEGLPGPAGVVLLTPHADLTESGDSFRTNFGIDSNLTQPSLRPANLLYAGGADLADPYVSPLFADFTRGFPPAFLATGTRDLLLSSTVLLHQALRAAGREADLHVLEAMPHAFIPGTPEDRHLLREILRFVDAHAAGRKTAGQAAGHR